MNKRVTVNAGYSGEGYVLCAESSWRLSKTTKTDNEILKKDAKKIMSWLQNAIPSRTYNDLLKLLNEDKNK